MKLPNGEVIMFTDDEGLRHLYDPVKAHQYYLRTRKLKGRKKGTATPALGRTATPKAQPSVNRARRKQELTARIATLEGKLKKLEALIKKKETAEAREQRESAKKQRDAKREAAKPATAAEKREKARESKQWRAKNQQKVKSDAKKRRSEGGGGSKAGTTTKEKPKASGSSVKDLKMTATKVRGQIATAKSKLRAL